MSKLFAIVSAVALLWPHGAQIAHAQTQPSAAPRPAVAAPQSEPTFDINKFTVRGATLISPEALNLILAPYTGKGKNFGDVQKALEALEKAYTSKGYNAVQVVLPEQEIEKGEIALDVVEAKVGKVVVEGNRHFDQANIRASMPHLQPGHAPNIFQIAEDLRNGIINRETAERFYGGAKVAAALGET